MKARYNQSDEQATSAATERATRDHLAARRDDLWRRRGGKAIFVRGGIAGERVQAEIVEERDRFARAQVIDVIEPSPERVQPRCPHFGWSANSCGGCAWQHIDYAAQLRFKTGTPAVARTAGGRVGARALKAVASSVIKISQTPVAWRVKPRGGRTRSWMWTGNIIAPQRWG